MPISSNKVTTQEPVASGLTGVQVTKFIAADRVYIKTKDTVAAPVTTKSNGVTPSGWTDLGMVNGKVQIAYEKELQEIRTGIENVLRDTYVRQKGGTFEFQLSQFDDVVMQAVSGLTASQIIAGSTYQFKIGSETIVEKALLLTSQDFLTGKEWQFYHPAARLSFNIEDNGEETVIRGTGQLVAFSFGGSENIMIGSIFA